MNDFDRVTRVLERHMSPIHARSVLRQALTAHKLQPTRFSIFDLSKVNDELQRGVRLFATEFACSRAMKDLAALCDAQPIEIESQTIEINVEFDISRARNTARRMCEQAGVSGLAVQKVTTIVSELARNIVSYAGTGRVDLLWQEVPARRITVQAIDQGPGIADLELILSGRYKSRTGLGKGLAGTRRLASRFDVKTSSAGTQVVAEIAL